MDPRTARIRALNDELRQHLAGGVAVMTPGVSALGQEAVDRIVKTVAVFDDFCHANDPYEEHDFGSFEAEGNTIFFKIDYFDRNLKYLSPDPTDPVVTVRVITVMLADDTDGAVGVSASISPGRRWPAVMTQRINACASKHRYGLGLEPDAGEADAWPPALPPVPSVTWGQSKAIRAC